MFATRFVSVRHLASLRAVHYNTLSLNYTCSHFLTARCSYTLSTCTSLSAPCKSLKQHKSTMFGAIDTTHELVSVECLSNKHALTLLLYKYMLIFLRFACSVSLLLDIYALHDTFCFVNKRC